MTRRQGQVAVVTGAGAGIGRAVAAALGEAGWRVVLAGRRREPLEACAAALEDALVHPADVADEAAVRELFAHAVERFGRVDLLFNNAGVPGPVAPVDELAAEQWRRVIDTNLTGAFLCAREAYRVMRAQSPLGGRIINNGSLSAQVPRAHAVAYTASKHGIAGLTKAIALEGRAHGIACGQIDIGNAATELASGLVGSRADGAPREPFISTRHVVDAVLYMASLPLDANVLALTVMATGMPFIGRG